MMLQSSLPPDNPASAIRAPGHALAELDDHPACEKLLCVLRPATGRAAQALGLAEGETIIHLRTLRRISDGGLCLTERYFADLNLWPALQRFERGSPLQYTARHMPQPLVHVHARIGTRRARARESDLLEVPVMTPLLCVETLKSPQSNGCAAVYAASLIRADAIEFTFEH
ncbi:UTRA domain-containing protein [Pluralibacter gergoviae]